MSFWTVMGIVAAIAVILIFPFILFAVMDFFEDYMEGL